MDTFTQPEDEDEMTREEFVNTEVSISESIELNANRVFRVLTKLVGIWGIGHEYVLGEGEVLFA